MQQRQRGIAHLAAFGTPRHLQLGFDQMRHRAADAAMAVTQEATMGVKRHRAVPGTKAYADALMLEEEIDGRVLDLARRPDRATPHDV